MSSRVAPWLDGLDEAWEAPQKPAISNKAPLATTKDAAVSLGSSTSRIPRPSLGGRASHSRQDLGMQRKRNPLAPLSRSDGNTLRRKTDSGKLTASRSVSAASDGSVGVCGTVQQRSKSASPGKRQETLEWKRRLVDGKVGYGDHTDLFGPSGLENIFTPTKAGNEEPKRKNRTRWLQNSDAPVPSSPPPWPSSIAGKPEIVDRTGTDSAVEDSQANGVTNDAEEEYGSFRSNPFDLESTAQGRSFSGQSPAADAGDFFSPNKAFIEPTQDEIAQNRTISGQTELEQEDFSPVYVTKHKTVSGQVDYAALDSHLVKQMQSEKDSLSQYSRDQSGNTIPAANEQSASDPEPSTFTDGPQSAAHVTDPNFSFSENLPTGSPLHNLCQNVQFQRGGYSRQGSFKQRPLSPSPSSFGQSLNPDASRAFSPLPPPAPTPPGLPTTPIQPEEPKSRSSGSPLKLFAAHDTFTSNRLLRRLSEMNPDGTLRQARPAVKQEERDRHRVPSSRNSFGSGELDHHSFDAEITITSASDSDKSGSDGSPGSEIIAPGSKMPLTFRFESSPSIHSTFKMKRRLSKQSALPSNTSTLQQPEDETRQAQGSDVEENGSSARAPEADHRAYGEGKRPPTSPFKNPTPKRRRTLHASELQNGVDIMNEAYHSQLQEAVGSRKRKDARQGETQNTADPETLAQRRILRPRNPTPSRRRREQIETELREAAEEFAEQEPEKLEAVMEQIESSMASEDGPTLEQQAQTLASEVAAFTLRVQKPSGELGERKRSVTTQDFLDEAMMVMNLIRAKARPQSNLGSVEESDAETYLQSTRADGSRQDDSSLRVSRPPSREGSGWRPRALQADTRVISHLRKFQENEGVDDTNFIANSIASLKVDDEDQVNAQVVVVDEKANVRITGPLIPPKKHEDGTESRPISQRSQGSTLHTQNSTGESTGQTVGTVSTHKSDNVGTLAPDAVAHLIGNEVGGMTFDKEQQRWVRVAKSPEKVHGSFLELPSTVTSDDDPFREISDLPVDEQKELRRLSSSGKRTDKETVDDQASPDIEATPVEPSVPHAEVRNASEETVVSRPVTRDGMQIHHIQSSSVMSKYTALASSQQVEKVETRATSWSDEELARMSAQGRGKQQAGVQETVRGSKRKQPSVGNISSPGTQDQARIPSSLKPQSHKDFAAADHNQGMQTVEEESYCDASSSPLRDSDPDENVSEIREQAWPARRTPSKPLFPNPPLYRGATRELSLRTRTFTKQFNAEPQEQSELSITAPLPGDRMMSLSLSVSRPVNKRQTPGKVTELQSSPSKGNSSFMLSELPDFTVHEEDEERPSERALAKRLAQHAAAEVNDRYAVAVKELVKILTDVNEEEPYWEDLKQLDLHNRSLGSLYGLNDFCTGIQSMIVSNNTLHHLVGAPSTVRRLDASSNQLSNLTSWNHLMNLQYLDISNNRLENLDGLSCLIHLREIRADGNKIKDISGVFDLDGLLKIRLRRNNLQILDFSGYNLSRLTHLDLSDNQIAAVDGLENLGALTDLILDNNPIGNGINIAQNMPHLRVLSVKNCQISRLDAAWFSNVTYLNVDDNQLCTIRNIEKLQHLNTLSMRRQLLPDDSLLSILESRVEAAIIQLSGNRISTLRLPHSLLNVRHLELASAGLQELPSDFGLRVPNLRTLNLNFNNLRDIRPILNIQHLERLSVCGNRLHRLRKSVATFERMPSLRLLDLRDNPLTQGLYANLASTMSKHTSLVRKVRDDGAVEEADHEVEAMERSRYEFPPAEIEDDERHRARLDEDTALRRRVYEVLLANSCRELVSLDGLSFDRRNVVRRDMVWDRLYELGIIRKSRGHVMEMLE